MSEISPRPTLLWRAGVLCGLGTATVLSVDDDAWEAFDEATGRTTSRDAIRALVAGTVVVHVLEAAAAYRSARRAGLHRPGRWGRATLLWGLPVLLRLHRARRDGAPAQKCQGNGDQSGGRFSRNESRPSAASSVM